MARVWVFSNLLWRLKRNGNIFVFECCEASRTSNSHNSYMWFTRTSVMSLFFQWKQKSEVHRSDWPVIFLQCPQDSSGQSKGYEILNVNGFSIETQTTKLYSYCKICLKSCRILHDATTCSQRSAKWKKASSSPGCSVWSPFAALNGSIFAEKEVWKDVFQKDSPCLLFVWYTNGCCLFLHSASLPCWNMFMTSMHCFCHKKKAQQRFLFLTAESEI